MDARGTGSEEFACRPEAPPSSASSRREGRHGASPTSPTCALRVGTAVGASGCPRTSHERRHAFALPSVQSFRPRMSHPVRSSRRPARICDDAIRGRPDKRTTSDEGRRRMPGRSQRACERTSWEAGSRQAASVKRRGSARHGSAAASTSRIVRGGWPSRDSITGSVAAKSPRRAARKVPNGISA